jgi:hypothetical protein
MRDHVRILAALFIALGVMGVLGAFITLALFGGAAGIIQAVVPADEPARSIAVPILGFFAVACFFWIMLLSVPDIIAGIGLFNLRPWGRLLGIVMCILNLMSFPFGTAVSVYGLWVLLSGRTDELFAARSPEIR